MDLNGDFFPECITKGSRFTLGVWGLGRVRSTLLLCSQPFATTVRTVPMIALWPCLWGVLQEWSLFEVSNVA